jgi:hypothetical protein
MENPGSTGAPTRPEDDGRKTATKMVCLAARRSRKHVNIAASNTKIFFAATIRSHVRSSI